MKVFIAGSMNIKHLDPLVKQRLDNILSQELEVVVGDADGVDTSIQSYLAEHGAKKATVYCSGKLPRNNIGNWTIRSVHSSNVAGTRAFFTAKDLEMARVADVGLMIWDTKSTGTLSNIIELLTRKKKSVVFVNKAKVFMNVANVEQLEQMLTYMSDHARKKADEKIQLFDKIASLKHEQFALMV